MEKRLTWSEKEDEVLLQYYVDKGVDLYNVKFSIRVGIFEPAKW
jgi:hypothetical protein